MRTTTTTTITITDPHTGQRFTHEMPTRAEARRLARRMTAAGYYATFGREVAR